MYPEAYRLTGMTKTTQATKYCSLSSNNGGLIKERKGEG